MRKLLTVILALFVSAPTWAFRARPVSDLRFESTVSFWSGFVASDGRDFLFLSSFSTNSYVYGQRFVGGTQVGPSLGLGAGTPAGIVWTGSEYLASWSSASGMRTARISRQGALVDRSIRFVNANPGTFASNGQSALAVGRVDKTTLLVQPLDLADQPSGPAVTLNMTTGENVAVAPSSSGYAIVTTGFEDTLLQRVRSDGTPLSTSPISLDGPYANRSDDYYSDHSVVASDGTDTMILFARERLREDTELRTVIIGPDGTVKRAARTAFTIPGAGGRSLQPKSVVWTGSEYVVALFVSKDPTGNFTVGDVGLLRISRNGDVIGDVAYVTSGPRRKVPIGLGWNGSEFLVPWSDSTNEGSNGSFCATVPAATMTPTAPAALLGRVLNTQSGLKIAANNGQYLAAWFETGTVTTVRASRIDSAGNFLDGEGIALGAGSPPSRNATSSLAVDSGGTNSLAIDSDLTNSLAIDSDGTNWFVVWTGGGVLGQRISRAGKLLDPQPLLITSGADVAVRWNGSSYTVVTGRISLLSAAVSRDGVVTSTRTLMPSSYQTEPSGAYTYLSYTSPSLVVAGGETLAVYQNDLTSCQPYCGTQSTIVGWRLDSAANPIGAPFTIAQNVWRNPKLATDGVHHLLTWSAYDTAAGTWSVFGTVLSVDTPEQGGTPFRIASRASLRDVAFDGSDFLVSFQTASSLYPFGTIRVTPAGAVKETTWLLLDDGESATNPMIATCLGMPTLIGFLHLHPAYDGRSRGAILFSTELTGPRPALPLPPWDVRALWIDQNTIDVRWQPAGGALGTSVELQLDDGAYRAIGVAGGYATSGRFSLAGLQGSGIRLRAWNAAGLSDVSLTIPIAFPRQRAVRAH